MKRFSPMNLIVAIIWMAPLIYLAYTFSALPNMVAVHFNIEGEPDRMGSKNEMAILVCCLSTISIGIYFLMKYLPKIDPKRYSKGTPSSFTKIGQAIILLISCIAFAIIWSAAVNKFAINKMLLPVLGIFFTYLGNIMYNIKPNYFTGIRTPWALENEDNWKATHWLAGKLWFVGGLVITVGTLLLSAKAAFIFFITIVLIITLIPFIFSYRYFKKHTSSNN